MTGSVVDDPRPWWRDAVVYQIYPRSFAEAPGPDGALRGVGNLRGITARLDHLRWLGVDALWLSPIFQSPMADFGYDISDYCAVDPTFGTLADLDELIAQAHARDMRIMLDWVPNHTSDQHPWFVESRRDRTNPKADWYVWRDGPANNWLAALPRGEPAWTFDELRQQHYLRCFLRGQPDLNWDVAEVEEAMLATLRFWLDRGVDGFRMDVVHLIAKEIDRDDPAEAVARGRDHVTYNDVPAVHPRLRRIRSVLDGYPDDRVCVGEVYLMDEARMAEYYGHDDELHLSFNFRFLWSPFDARELRSRITATLATLAPRDAWPTWVLSNHDAPRHRQRYGGDEHIARMAAVLLLTLPGTPFLYQGEELGLLDAVVPPELAVDPGGRDGSRAPIPWTDEPDRGWGPHPWLPLPPEADTRNVAAQLADPAGMLRFYQRLLTLRRETPALHRGSFQMLGDDAADGDLLAFVRADERVAGERWLISINPTTEPRHASGIANGAVVVLSSDRALEGSTLGDLLPPAAAVVARLA
ncbi:MAG: putative glycosyl hydrolase, family 13 [Ilumatobacteraceae bacterium]|nr:putative glycosyl hydrolase, family 13 [Ilumatobacteraceae bacterium]